MGLGGGSQARPVIQANSGRLCRCIHGRQEQLRAELPLKYLATCQVCDCGLRSLGEAQSSLRIPSFGGERYSTGNEYSYSSSTSPTLVQQQDCKYSTRARRAVQYMRVVVRVHRYCIVLRSKYSTRTCTNCFKLWIGVGVCVGAGVCGCRTGYSRSPSTSQYRVRHTNWRGVPCS